MNTSYGVRMGLSSPWPEMLEDLKWSSIPDMAVIAALPLRLEQPQMQIVASELAMRNNSFSALASIILFGNVESSNA